MLKVSVVGASGYVGGELLRLILAHPNTELQQATSQRYAERFLHTVHPNLRGISKHKFSSIESLESCDLISCVCRTAKRQVESKSFRNLLPRLSTVPQISEFGIQIRMSVGMASPMQIRQSEKICLWSTGIVSRPNRERRPSVGSRLQCNSD